MAKILLDYVFPISVVETIPSANTAWLKQACLVVKPNTAGSAQIGNIIACTSTSQIDALTDCPDGDELLAAGMSKVYVLPSLDLEIADAMADGAGDFFTVLVSSDFHSVSDVNGIKPTLHVGNLTFEASVPGDDGELVQVAFLAGSALAVNVASATIINVTLAGTTSTATQISAAVAASAAAMDLLSGAPAIDSGQGATVQTAHAAAPLDGGVNKLDLGGFTGVVGLTNADEDFLAVQAAISNRCAFYGLVVNKAKNMCHAFGKFLSANSWADQQYLAEPNDDDVALLGDALTLFNAGISFVITDDDFGTRLGLFAAGKKAIRAPYVVKNLQIDMQSAALSWIAANQPSYTKVEATLLETRLQVDVIEAQYIATKQIESGSVVVSVVPGSNFTAKGEINIAEPKALWRVESTLTQS